MVRGYDSGVVLREDIIERVRQFYAEIEQLQREIDEVKERLKATTKELRRRYRSGGLFRLALCFF